MSGLPPIRFVPDRLHEGTNKMDDKNHKNCVKIFIPENVSEYFKLFEEGGPEAVSMLIRSHESLVQDRKLCEVYSSASVLIVKRSAIKILDPVSNCVLIE